MRLFGGKDSIRARGAGEVRDSGGEPVPSHRLTLELQRTEKFAAMLAQSRFSPAIEISDYLAGMYICNWEHLSEYWADHDQEEVERLLRSICSITPQRWHAWIELYDRQHREGEAHSWHLFRRWKKNVAQPPPRPSAALLAVLKQAEQIAPSYDRTQERSIPILNTECVLLSIVRNLGSEISRKLALTGLDIARLEREVLVPRRRPRT